MGQKWSQVKETIDSRQQRGDGVSQALDQIHQLEEENAKYWSRLIEQRCKKATSGKRLADAQRVANEKSARRKALQHRENELQENVQKHQEAAQNARLKLHKNSTDGGADKDRLDQRLLEAETRALCFEQFLVEKDHRKVQLESMIAGTLADTEKEKNQRKKEIFAERQKIVKLEKLLADKRTEHEAQLAKISQEFATRRQDGAALADAKTRFAKLNIAHEQLERETERLEEQLGQLELENYGMAAHAEIMENLFSISKEKMQNAKRSVN